LKFEKIDPPSNALDFGLDDPEPKIETRNHFPSFMLKAPCCQFGSTLELVQFGLTMLRDEGPKAKPQASADHDHDDQYRDQDQTDIAKYVGRNFPHIPGWLA